jgi:hypothetical protein
MCTNSSRASGRLRVTQAYIALSGIPGCHPAPKTVSLERVGDYEIRMFSGAPPRSDDAPLLWMELFDHAAQSSLDSASFREIHDALSAFDIFVAQAKPNSAGPAPE